jgi:hypothetical protein
MNEDSDRLVVLGSVVKRWHPGLRRWADDIMEVDHLKNDDGESWKVSLYLLVRGKQISAVAPTLGQAERIVAEDAARLLPPFLLDSFHLGTRAANLLVTLKRMTEMYEHQVTDEYQDGVPPGDDETTYLTALRLTQVVDVEAPVPVNAHHGWCWSNRGEEGPYHFAGTRAEALTAALAAAPKTGGTFDTGHAFLMIGRVKTKRMPISYYAAMSKPFYLNDRKDIEFYAQERVPPARARFELARESPGVGKRWV